MKNKKIKILALMCCFCLCLIFSGCANVTYSLVIKDNYTILQQIKIELDTKDIEKHNANIIEMKTEIENYVKEYDNSYSSYFSYNLSNFSRLSPANYQLATLIEKAVTTKTAWVGNTFVYNIQFSAVKDKTTIFVPVNNVYYFYYTGKFELEDNAGDTTIHNEEQLFQKMYKETTSTSFDSEMCNKIEQDFMNKYGTYGFTLEDVSYAYQYGTMYSRIHSDADEVTNQNGVYIHKWNLTSKDQPITLYRNIAKPVAWYVLAVSCAIITSIVIFTIAIIKRKKKLKNDISNIV